MNNCGTSDISAAAIPFLLCMHPVKKKKKRRVNRIEEKSV